MKKITLLLLSILIFLSNTILAQTDTNYINKKRFFLVSSSLASGLVASYLYVQNAWWSAEQIPFHFDDGSDLTYALNLDKAGHFLGGLQASDLFSSSMRWTGMKTTKALWYGAAFGTGLQLAIEMKDAYAPYWGFSKWDLALGSAGSLWPVLQHHNKDFSAISFKLSYYKRSNIYWQLDQQRGKETSSFNWQDDYPNQTYWMTFDINHFLDLCCWPEWLNLAIGYGIDDTQYLDDNLSKTGGNREFYIAFDYDLPKMLKNWNSPLGKRVSRWLNYMHFPAPTIRISPKFEFYPLFI
ncbi:MAG: DUF2279 domain-containing protein [Flavobacteriales bacterium]|nr:DUF2279 domain-containing protein [Flavobacteriales bacterium]